MPWLYFIPTYLMFSSELRLSIMFAYLVNWFCVGEVKANFTLNKRHLFVEIVWVGTKLQRFLNLRYCSMGGET
jgi:hypothetical protein